MGVTGQTLEVQPPRGDATREALLEAAMAVFARDGFDAASTRRIATAAGVNQALIGYHFGGKQGLYLAVFDQIAGRVRERIEPHVHELELLLGNPDTARGAKARRAIYLPALQSITDRMLALLLSPETENWSALILREQARPTAAFDRLYDGFMGRMLALLTELVLRLRGDGDEAAARLAVVSVYGQLIVWRAARAGVMRHLGWTRLTERELALAQRSLRESIAAQLSTRGTNA
jgi:AcrR family transcriptional regulator